MNVKILSEKSISMFELKQELEKIEEKDKELNFRANKTKDYLNNFITLNKKQKEELTKKINALKVPRLKEEHIIKIVDLIPKTTEELKVILQQFTITISNDNVKKVIEVVKAVVPEKKKKE
tara:strand:- start:1738 stop:2100 length:363 start_codon:yes stop_codon:yes gene_type:complete